VKKVLLCYQTFFKLLRNLLPANGSGNGTRAYITHARILLFLCLRCC